MNPIATLIANPAARNAASLRSRLPEITALLATHGLTAEILWTTPDLHSARSLAEQSSNSALILACGGDGTVHGVIQAMARTSTPLGVIPAGTANALARNLGLPLDPLAALQTLLTWTPKPIPLGQITTTLQTRYFAVLAGCGPDGALVQTLATADKSRLGRSAYYAHAAKLFLTRRWPTFQVEYRLPDSAEWLSTHAVAMMCSRVPDLGGLFSGLTPDSRLDDPYLRVQLLKAPAQLSLPAWFALGNRPNPWLTTLKVEELRCTPLTPEPIYAQADGESQGAIPITLTLFPNSLNLLLPPRFQG